MRSLLRPFVLSLALGLPAMAQKPVRYIVLNGVSPSDPLSQAAQHLADHHEASVMVFDPSDVSSVKQALREADPHYVALVLRPEQIDFSLQRRFLQMATELDDDPFVDFAFGYITGTTGEEALALAKRGTQRQPQTRDLRFASVAGGVDKSMRGDRAARLGSTRVPTLRIYSAGEKAFPEEGRDRAFLAKHLGELAGRDVVTFIGHGYPHEVHGGPDHRDIHDLDLAGAVALNVACYTGTTDRWFESDYRRRVIEEKHVPADESFCLNVLRSGVVGYTAYVCPRPAGPELDTDRTALVFGGASLGDARRRDYDKTVLGFLGFGEPRMQLREIKDGVKLPANVDAVRDMMLEGATGGVLFGDPACVPFAARPDESPVKTVVQRDGENLQVHTTVAGNVLFTHCADPTARWDSGMAMKVHMRVPLDEAQVADVVVAELRIGKEVAPTRLLWAIEEDHGARFLQAKVNFPRGTTYRGDVRCVVRVETTTDATKAKRRGGEVHKVASRDAGHRAPATGDPFALAETRGVAREAVEAAIAAMDATLRGDEQQKVALAKLASFEDSGFEATLCLLECGRTHYRMCELLRATWRPGKERRLIALASGPPLPRYATWSVLKGLGVADTPAVRAYLAQRLESDEDAGTWMSTAEALAMLGAREHVETIGARVLEFRDRWSGVEPHLLNAIGKLGGEQAVVLLEKIAKDANCKNWKSALSWLDRLDVRAAERVREARGVQDR